MLETENGAELSTADVTDALHRPADGREPKPGCTDARHRISVAPGREEHRSVCSGSYKEVACYGFAEDLEHPSATARWKRVFYRF
ncbi:MAG: hypothetical protein ACLURV_07550 [Gallintestinimicrobium sp.]